MLPSAAAAAAAAAADTHTLSHTHTHTHTLSMHTHTHTYTLLRAQVKEKHLAAGGDQRFNTGGSTRSAIEGSLLYRVEVLEEAMEVLLASQEVLVLV